MALNYTINDVTGSVPGGPEGCFGKPAAPFSDDFKRQISDASTTAPDTPMHRSASPDSAMTSFLPMGSMSPMMHYDLPDCDSSEETSAPPSHTAKAPEQVFLAMAGGAPFQMPIASALFCLPPTEKENEAEAKAVEVEAKFGEDVDAEEDEAETPADEDGTECVKKDGISWVVARGRPPTMSQLEGRLAEVKSLYKARYGADADEEEDEDEAGSDADEHKTECVEKDGITWVVARGRPPTMSQLEDKLAEVKSLYKAKLGTDVDEEGEDEEDEAGSGADEAGPEHVVKDGITWVVARGRPPTLAQLEERLAEVKSLYKAKLGEDVDEEDDDEEAGSDADEAGPEHVEKDGITWVVARGRPPTISQLEERLAEVKSLYKAKLGEDVDEGEGTWVVPRQARKTSRACVFSFSRRTQMTQVSEDRIESVEKDGISWVVARGRPPTISQLEERLAEVKSLYKTKFGEDLDEEEEEEDEEVGNPADEDGAEHVVKNGITWVVARGRPPTISQLEERLAEVKSLYKAKLGEDVDEGDDEDEVGSDADDDEAVHVVKDGVRWVVARGRPPTMSQLEERLAEVKSLYKAKFGEDVDEEEELAVGRPDEEDGAEHVERDGITWVVARGRPPTMSQLEERLAEVKSLYRAKSGEDVDEADEEEEDEEVGNLAGEDGAEHVVKDGVTWVVARGRPPTVSQLEERLAEVKSLYKAKLGEDVDEEEEEEEVGNHAEEDGAEHVEKDGISWIVARGRPPTMSQLEDRLAEVKRMYAAKFGRSVDDDEEDSA